MMQQTLILYYRNGCHLCEDMASAIYPLSDIWNFSIEDIDIDTDKVLIERFNADVPVLTTEDGTVICKHFFNAEQLKNILQQGANRCSQSNTGS